LLHCWHEEDPAVDVKDPARHGWHTVELTAFVELENDPAGHNMQLDILLAMTVSEYVPVGQEVQPLLFEFA
jgi:hypothetical protein